MDGPVAASAVHSKKQFYEELVFSWITAHPATRAVVYANAWFFFDLLVRGRGRERKREKGKILHAHLHMQMYTVGRRIFACISLPLFFPPPPPSSLSLSLFPDQVNGSESTESWEVGN